MSGACVDNYVVSCNPAPVTPASEVVVVRTEVPELLAPTGGEIAGGLLGLALFLMVIGAVGAIGRRKR